MVAKHGRIVYNCKEIDFVCFFLWSTPHNMDYVVAFSVLNHAEGL